MPALFSSHSSFVSQCFCWVEVHDSIFPLRISDSKRDCIIQGDLIGHPARKYPSFEAGLFSDWSRNLRWWISCRKMAPNKTRKISRLN